MGNNGFAFAVKKFLNQARLTELQTPHGLIEGPFFQFVATQAAIRGQVFSEDLEALQVQVVLANTYHLHLRPGEEVVAEAGGLHQFMQWDGPMTTDSGGYQVFSLGDRVKLDRDGVTFHSPLDGGEHRLTPELTMQIERKLGADLIMPLDVCTPFRASREEVAAAVEQTHEWAKRCKAEHIRLEAEMTSSKHQITNKFQAPNSKTPQSLYGIVQGGLYEDLREKAANGLREIGFFGYSIGGELRDGEGTAMEPGVKLAIKYLPEDAPRYVMGAGAPEDIVRLVRLGVDQFDCVLPIRNARHGKIFLSLNEDEVAACLQDPERPVEPDRLYREINIKNSGFARDWRAMAPGHPVFKRPYTIGYLHHLMRAEAPSGYRLAVLNNMWFYVRLFTAIRQAIASGS